MLSGVGQTNTSMGGYPQKFTLLETIVHKGQICAYMTFLKGQVVHASSIVTFHVDNIITCEYTFLPTLVVLLKLQSQ